MGVRSNDVIPWLVSDITYAHCISINNNYYHHHHHHVAEPWSLVLGPHIEEIAVSCYMPCDINNPTRLSEETGKKYPIIVSQITSVAKTVSNQSAAFSITASYEINTEDCWLSA